MLLLSSSSPLLSHILEAGRSSRRLPFHSFRSQESDQEAQEHDQDKEKKKEEKDKKEKAKQRWKIIALVSFSAFNTLS